MSSYFYCSAINCKLPEQITPKELIVIYQQELIKDIRLFTSQPVAHISTVFLFISSDNFDIVDVYS